MLDFETKGYTQYGAQMGRSYTAEYSVPEDYSGKLHIRRVRLDSGGYDKGGAYWGHDAPLWCIWGDSEDGADVLTSYRRASSRDAVKAMFPNARFYR
jgi:hypothetical protein